MPAAPFRSVRFSFWHGYIVSENLPMPEPPPPSRRSNRRVVPINSGSTTQPPTSGPRPSRQSRQSRPRGIVPVPSTHTNQFTPLDEVHPNTTGSTTNRRSHIYRNSEIAQHTRGSTTHRSQPPPTRTPPATARTSQVTPTTNSNPNRSHIAEISPPPNLSGNTTDKGQKYFPDNECSVCAGEFEESDKKDIQSGNKNGNVVLLDCGHLYHKSCIKKWFCAESGLYIEGRHCPLCNQRPLERTTVDVCGSFETCLKCKNRYYETSESTHDVCYIDATYHGHGVPSTINSVSQGNVCHTFCTRPILWIDNNLNIQYGRGFFERAGSNIRIAYTSATSDKNPIPPDALHFFCSYASGSSSTCPFAIAYNHGNGKITIAYTDEIHALSQDCIMCSRYILGVHIVQYDANAKTLTVTYYKYEHTLSDTYYNPAYSDRTKGNDVFKHYLSKILDSLKTEFGCPGMIRKAVSRFTRRPPPVNHPICKLDFPQFSEHILTPPAAVGGGTKKPKTKRYPMSSKQSKWIPTNITGMHKGKERKLWCSAKDNSVYAIKIKRMVKATDRKADRTHTYHFVKV